jgi:phosphoribosylformylglycinamidine synthase
MGVSRVEVRAQAGERDPLAESVLAQARAVLPGVAEVRVGRVYLIEAPLNPEEVRRIATELLADPVNQRAVIGAEGPPEPPEPPAPPAPPEPPEGGQVVEVHYRPGVMDPVAQSTQEAICDMFPRLRPEQVQVRTGHRYDFVAAAGAAVSAEKLHEFAQTVLANPVIHEIHSRPYQPGQFEHGRRYELKITRVPLTGLDDAQLTRLSRQAHLFLSLEEMRTIREYFRRIGREPTDIELETLAQTWSEHCVHKTLKSTIRYRQRDGGAPSPRDWADRLGHTLEPDGSVTIDNLLKSTIVAATRELMSHPPHRDWCVSVFQDNAGIVRFDERDGVCIKVETHNHPSAIEPYGGAATGIGGCIRDIMGTGLSARPVANTDVFCVAPPAAGPDLPKGVIAPRRTLEQVVAGVRDYGNRMGIPTVNGAVWFHEDYLANPLVFAGCVGLIPLDRCFGKAQPGDRIVVLGGRTGRDGIHGATFSSAELTDTHADEFAHAVQIGNAITQKKMMDVILQARDAPEAQGGPLFHAITDCGAGGFSSAVGEMGRSTGARVALEAAPLKYEGLSYTEIWISEAQERMVLAVPPDKVAPLRALCEAEEVELCDLGEFGAAGAEGSPELVLSYRGTEVGRLSMGLLHEGCPTPTRVAEWSSSGGAEPRVTAPSRDWPAGGTEVRDLDRMLLALLSHPNIASKHWIIRQYDHEVQGGSVVKPLVGPGQDGPSDAAVLRPKLSSRRGVAIACGLQPGLSEKAAGGHGDSYWMALAAIDEAVRNCVCVGADPARVAILDNFCWPGCDDPQQLGALVRAAEGCYDGALAYRTPFVSGKDSLNNQFTTESGRVITIPPTLLITALGIVPDVSRCRTMDAKAAGHALLIVGVTTGALGGSHYLAVTGDLRGDLRIPRVDLEMGPACAAAVGDLIAQGLIASAHDCSDGGLLVAAAEMAFAGGVGLELDLDAVPAADKPDVAALCFAETPGRYLLEVASAELPAVERALRQADVPFARIGTFAEHRRLVVRRSGDERSPSPLLDLPLDTLRQAWLKPLDW